MSKPLEKLEKFLNTVDLATELGLQQWKMRQILLEKPEISVYRWQPWASSSQLFLTETDANKLRKSLGKPMWFHSIPEGEYLDFDEVASILDVSKPWVYSIGQKQIPTTEVSGDSFTPRSLARWYGESRLGEFLRNNESRIVSIEQASRILGVEKEELTRLKDEGKIKAYARAHKEISRDDLLAFVNSRRDTRLSHRTA